MRVVALYRVSTEKQASEGASLESQQRDYHALAVQHGWATVAEFRGCESATQAATDRRVLQQVLACIRDQGPDAVYVHEQSRLTRGDELEVALLMRELRERRLKIIVHGVVRDLDSIDERFMIGIQSLVDRAESERIKERMGRGKRERARQGKKTSGPAPFGYENPPPGAPGRGTLRIVPDEAVVVQRIFAMAAAGHGDRAVAVALDAQGVRSPRGGRWGKTSVRRVLNNPAYIGTAASNAWVTQRGKRSFRFEPGNSGAILVEDAHPPIVERETWDAVHGRAPLPRTAVPRMLTGMLWVNGRAFAGDSSRGRSYYRGPRGTKGCPWLEAGATDAAVWDAFASLATEPALVERLMAEAQSPHQQLILSREIDYTREQLDKHRRREDRLVEMRADGEIDRATFQEKVEEARATVRRLEAELVELRSKAVSLDGTQASRVVKAVQVLLAGRTRLTQDQKRAVLRSIVRRIDVAAVPSGAEQARDERGRVLPGTLGRWTVQSVSFQLALPAEGGAPDGAPVPGGTGLSAVDGATGRAGRLATPAFDRGQGPDAEVGEHGNLRVGGLATNPSCSAPPAPARP